MRINWKPNETPTGTPMHVKVKDLLPGDYVVPAKATVLMIDGFADAIIVDFTNRTATVPIPGMSEVDIQRPLPN